MNNLPTDSDQFSEESIKSEEVNIIPPIPTVINNLISNESNSPQKRSKEPDDSEFGKI